jgi:pimeloyl-ACP methyl ester carboxylesterase
VEAYIREHGLSEVILNGHSMGGAIALTLALRRPRWLKGLVLTGTGARLRVSPKLLELLRGDYPAAVEMIVQESLSPLLEPLTYKQRIRRNGLRRHILRTPQMVTLNDYEACDRFDVMARVGEIAVPTLCIVGSQDRMTPPKYSEYLHSQISGSQLAIIEGAGHMLPLEKPEEYNRNVLEFLRAS